MQCAEQPACAQTERSVLLGSQNLRQAGKQSYQHRHDDQTLPAFPSSRYVVDIAFVNVNILTCFPGFHKTSVAYVSTGHRRFNQPFTPTPYGPAYVQGDVIGVGYKPRTGSIFFTRNGKRLDEFAPNLKSQNFFPTVGANGPCTVHVNFGQMGFVYIEANVKKWGLAPMTGSLAPPPPYGSEQGSILLESGREGVRQPEYQPGHSRTRSGLARLGLPSGNPGPVRTHTDISLSQLAHVPSNDFSPAASGSLVDIGDVQHQPVENTPAGQQIIPPPEYSSPTSSQRSSNSDEDEDEDDYDDDEAESSYRDRNGPPIPSYEAALGEPGGSVRS